MAFHLSTKQSTCSPFRERGGSTGYQDQETDPGTPTSSPSSSRVPLPAGAEERRQQRGEQRAHQWGGGILRRHDRSLAAAPGLAESLERCGRNRRPASAAGRASFSELADPSASVGGSRTRMWAGARAVSMSCPPVRLRRSRTSIAMRPARGQEFAQQRRAIGRLGKGISGVNSRVDLGGRSSPKVSGRAVVGRLFGSERSSGGRGFFSPSREGGRIRLLR